VKVRQYATLNWDPLQPNCYYLGAFGLRRWRVSNTVTTTAISAANAFSRINYYHLDFPQYRFSRQHGYLRDDCRDWVRWGRRRAKQGPMVFSRSYHILVQSRYQSYADHGYDPSCLVVRSN